MKWYIAHIIMYTKFKDGNQNKFPVWENIVLIEADTPKEAYQKAKLRAKNDEGDSSNSYYYDDRAATWVFGGIRKLVDCEDVTIVPSDGMEMTYSTLEVDNEENLNRLIKGDSVLLKYVD
jgi:hypothetical protein